MATNGDAVLDKAEPSLPFRSELLGADRLAEDARALAARQQWAPGDGTTSTPLIPLTRAAAAELERDNVSLSAEAREQRAVSPASEWLLDNYYLVEEQVLAVLESLPARYDSELPRLVAGDYAGYPRVYELAVQLLGHTDSHLDEESLLRFTRGFQEASPLTIGEVWAVPIMLRIALVENLRRLSREVVSTQRAERLADRWAERLVIVAQEDRQGLPALIAELDQQSSAAPAVFYVRLSQRLADVDGGAEPVNRWMEHRLAVNQIDLAGAALESQQRQAANQVSIANSVRSIVFLDSLDWNAFFEQVSVVEELLSRDPAGVYAHMDFRSRDRYRHIVEDLSKRCPLSAIEIVERALHMASRALAEDPTDDRRGHVGWWVFAEGRPLLEAEIGYRPAPRQRVTRAFERHRSLFYGGTLVALTAALLLLVGWYANARGASVWQIGVLALLAVIPLSEVAVTATNRIATIIFPPRVLAKLDFREPLDEKHRTLAVVPTLLTSPEGTQAVIDSLEVAYLANRDPNIAFGLLGDLRASSGPERTDDAELVEVARHGIEKLNERYLVEHGVRPFHLLIRGRTLSETEGVWMGWERKRGALVELTRLLSGRGRTSFTLEVGDADFRHAVAFVITLDTDTVLPRDGARRLVSAIAHPLNRAELSADGELVRTGYGLVQPRVGMTLGGATRSRFARIYSGPTGIDPYAAAASDVYQDVFGEGSFTGKGIFEVQIFEAVLEGRFPENTLLSHDLVEGCFLRTALASEIEVLDDYPANYLSASSRLHRWVRGDWQTLPWLKRTVPDDTGKRSANPLGPLCRWKITDNLRRSLVPPTTLVLMTLGWLLVPGPATGWLALMIAVIFFPAYFSFANSLLVRSTSISFRIAAPPILKDFALDSVKGLLTLVTLPHQALLMVDATVRSLWRQTISRRRLLEWETAADAEKRAGKTPAAFYRAMGPSSAAGVVLAVAATDSEAVRLWATVPLAVAWAAAPLICWWISQPREIAAPKPLSAKEHRALRRVARKTWRYFDEFVTAEGHYLAPDNFQEDPKGEVAWRTSPTNIGLQLISCLGAWDLGYVAIDELVDRTASTLATMAGLERFRGHFFNWYDIRTLEPLRPSYVSTVDSGNLAGHLLVLRVGLLEASEAPLVGPQTIDGILDSVRLALEDVVLEGEAVGPPEAAHAVRAALDELERAADIAEIPADLEEWRRLLERLACVVDETEAALRGLAGSERGDLGDERAPFPSTSLERIRASVTEAARSVRRPLALIESLAAWTPLLAQVPAHHRDDAPLAPLLDHVPSLVGLAEGFEPLLDWLDGQAGGDGGEAAWAGSLAEAIRSARQPCIELLARLRLNADIAREMWEHTDFRLLFDQKRLLFSIGYNLAEGRPDPTYYDLLASECRLASFLAVAKGDVSQEHWFRLGRQLTDTSCGRALVSWSASMFEYLMPLLVMRSWDDTLLSQTYGSIVCDQISYGRRRGVPWGVSESAFNAKDAELNYQYQAFGVPGLGLKRGLSEDIVVAPYASLLALPIDPTAVSTNLGALSREGAEGRWGYYEALDFTPGRIPAGETRAVVRAFFAHHQGMGFVAIANHLTSERMVERFHADPIVGSAELLLQERVPRNVQPMAPHVEEVRYVRSVRELPPPVTRSYPTADTPVPSTHFLSNGRYSVMVTNAGGGYSRWHGTAVTRYREDVTRDCWGTFFYVRDAENGDVFSVPYAPWPAKPDEFHATFSPDKAEYRRTDGDLHTAVEIVVSPEDDVEIRRITITNSGRQPRLLELTSYFEIALAEQAADQAHKSFSNLFVETDVREPTRSILFTRRPRSSEEERRWGFHLLACEEEACDWSFETDRSAFLGRLRGVDAPRSVEAGGALGGSVGAVLDPACAIRRTVTLGPGASSRSVFVTGVTDDEEAAVRLSEKYHDVRSAQRAVDLAWTAAQLELRDLGITPAQAVTFERLASRLLLTDPHSPLKIKTPVENGLPISGLWSIGISGDLPILLVRVDELEHTPLVRQALLAHQYWRHKGLVSDLVVLNSRPSAYADELEDRLRLLVRTGHALQLLDKPGGVYLRRADQMHPDVLNLLLSVARATLDGDSGSIELQLNRRAKRPEPPAPLIPTRTPDRARPESPLARPDLLFDNGVGGFDRQNGDYVIVLDGETTTPAPWVNVMAGPEFGCLVSEAGIGCTWSKNSHENRVTTWNNDPVSDGSGEVLYLRDEETGEFWSPTPLPVRDGAPYVIRHGKGVTRFEHVSHGIAQHVEWFAPPDEPVRIIRVRLDNLGDDPRRLTVTHFVEWVLASSRSRAQQVVVTWFDAENELLTAHNHYNIDFPGRCSFLASDRPLHSFTASRTEFVGRNRRPSDPAAMQRKGLGGVSGRYHDNCGAVMTELELAPGGTEEVCFFLGQTETLDECRRLVAAYRADGAVGTALERTSRFWGEILGRLHVTTPDPALDLMLNGNLLYQTTSCRMWGRTGTYQSSGAMGFRDQLQDSLALLLARPDITRAQIVEASRHQFPEGDVLHWWQPHSGRGVRTHITDDRLWLPLVVAEYLEATGDRSVLDELTPFIEGQPLPLEQEDAYLQPPASELVASVFEHCIRAIEVSRPTGAHGLPLIGGGDWNDGMNRVGHEGRGESVWLAWFLGYVLVRFAPVCELLGEKERADEYREWASRLARAVEETAWDGAWYRRAYFDDGTPLGTREAEECRIDAIAQAWATISGLGDPERARQALDAVDEKLVRREDGLIALLTPPFDRMTEDPGYIKGYVPGVRENGGQYTHAATWVALAYLLRGDGGTGESLLQLINPVTHAKDAEAVARYRVEPYVVAADVYAVEPHVGRGGWTWYTGSAAWYYRVAVQWLLGVRTIHGEGGRCLRVDPCVPKSWPGFAMTFREGGATYHIRVDNPRGVDRGVDHVHLDGVRLTRPEIPLIDDGKEHEVVVTMLGG